MSGAFDLATGKINYQKTELSWWLAKSSFHKDINSLNGYHMFHLPKWKTKKHMYFTDCVNQG